MRRRRFYGHALRTGINGEGLGFLTAGKECRALLIPKLYPYQLTLSPGLCRDS